MGFLLAAPYAGHRCSAKAVFLTEFLRTMRSMYFPIRRYEAVVFTIVGVSPAALRQRLLFSSFVRQFLSPRAGRTGFPLVQSNACLKCLLNPKLLPFRQIRHVIDALKADVLDFIFADLVVAALKCEIVVATLSQSWQMFFVPTSIWSNCRSYVSPVQYD